MEAREINFSVNFTTAESGTAECTDYLGNPFGTVVSTLKNTLGAIVASILATHTIVDFTFPKDVEIKGFTLSLEPGKTANGKLFVMAGPESGNPNEIISNYDLNFMNNRKFISFDPKVPHRMKLAASADLRTIRILIKGHTAGQKIKYQLSFDAEEYTNAV